MSFTTRKAETTDASAITRIFSSDETSEFLCLQFGTVDPEVFKQGLAERIQESIEKAEEMWIVACDHETSKVVSYAQWVLPRDEYETVIPETPEDKAHSREEYRNKLPPGVNEDLIMSFREGVGDMRSRALQGRRHYLLSNLGTTPWYQGRGAATALVRWPFEDADRDRVVVYLDTDRNGSAKRIYERLGFEEVGEAQWDLKEYGGSGVHSHVAMIRKPQ